LEEWYEVDDPHGQKWLKYKNKIVKYKKNEVLYFTIFIERKKENDYKITWRLQGSLWMAF
jgi:hypothetical protein